MVNCVKCKSTNIIEVSAKCSDLCAMVAVNYEWESDGYVPDDFGIGGGDYIEFTYCLTCGQIQDTFPKQPDIELS